MKNTFLLFLLNLLSFSLLAAEKTYISEITVSTHSSSESAAKKALTDKGYTVIDKDCNEGAGGDYVYIGYKTTTDQSLAIKRLYVVYNTRGIYLEGSMEKYASDLNMGTNKDKVFIYYTTHGNDAPLTELGVSKDKNNRTNNAEAYSYNGYFYSKEEDPANLNYGAGGQRLYLNYERDEHIHTWDNGFCDCGAYEMPEVEFEGGKKPNEMDFYYDYALIKNAGNLYWIAQSKIYYPIILVNDIVVNSNVLTSDGELNSKSESSFRKWSPLNVKKIEGNSHTISGLYIKSNTDRIGLHRGSGNLVVTNLGILDSYFEGNSNVGSIIGGNGKAINCYSKAIVKGENQVGGICGYGDADSCRFEGKVYGTSDQIGGVIGQGDAANCQNAGTVSGAKYVGGVSGQGNVTNCINTGTVSGVDDYVGGVAGYGKATNCHNTGTVSGKAQVGGVSGHGSAYYCYNIGAITGVGKNNIIAVSTGGICGECVEIQNCFNIGNITGEDFTGGLAGKGDVWNSYNKGIVISSKNNSGNITGDNSGDGLSTCYYSSELSKDAEGDAIQIEEEAFSSGMLAMKLHNYSTREWNGKGWGQKVGTDKYPTFCELSGSFTIKVEVEGDGTVTGAGTHEFGQSAKIEATANSGSEFRGWSDGVTDPIRYESFTASLTAKFSPQEIVVMVVADGDGTVEGGEQIVPFTQEFTVKAHANKNSKFDKWLFKFTDKMGSFGSSKDSIYTSKPTDIYDKLKDNDTLLCIASFSLIDVKVSTKTEGEGEVTGNGTFHAGSTDTLIATPKEGYHFAKWSDGDTNPVREVVLLSDTIFTAIFEPHHFENGICACDSTIYEPIVDEDEDGYYEINNTGQLFYFMALINRDDSNANIKAVLTDNIVVNDTLLESVGNGSISTNIREWVPINLFKGVLDGKGYSISGLYCKSPEKGNIGFINQNQGIVKNIAIIDSYFEGSDNVGSLCASLSSAGLLSNCYNEGVVKGANNVGGLCGTNEDGNIMKCYNAGDVEGSADNVGGICGVNNASLSECYNEGKIKGSHNNVGGVCGEVSGEKSLLYNCYNAGNVNGFNYVGGICGDNESAMVANSFNVGVVTGDGIIKSICGLNKGKVDNCFFEDETGDDLAMKKTETEFKDGTVAQLLHDYKSELISGAAWGQDANVDSLPNFSGVIVEPTAVSTVWADDDIVEIVYYNVNGQRLVRPQIGVNVVMVRYQSGRIECLKQIVRE